MPKSPQKRSLSSFQIILLGFAGVILLGALILMLPISSRDGVVTPFNESLFTATSATCVTGLIVQDTATHWSSFGQVIIILLIQIGGLGVVTVGLSLALLSGRKLSLRQRSTMQDSISAPKFGGIIELTGFILKGTFLIELIGALIMMPTFIKDFGAHGIWMAVFHSISSFCNAGFDIMGTYSGEFSSMTAYAADPVISLTIPLLIIIGGIGFLTWKDITTHKFKLRKYSMQSKVILVTTLALIVIPGIYFYCFEFQNLPTGERFLTTFFQVVTPRTAGSNTADLTQMSSAGNGIMTALMLIGGAPGGTAGGMKVTTLAVLLALSRSIFSRKNDTNLFKRRISSDTVKQAATILLMYVTLWLIGGLAISTIEGISLGTCLYETASAVGTVGLTLGITPSLSVWSQVIIMILMFLGRVGGLTAIYAALARKHDTLARFPKEGINVG